MIAKVFLDELRETVTILLFALTTNANLFVAKNYEPSVIITRFKK